MAKSKLKEEQIEAEMKRVNQNQYIYCSANPVRYTDVMGFDIDDET